MEVPGVSQDSKILRWHNVTQGDTVTLGDERESSWLLGCEHRGLLGQDQAGATPGTESQVLELSGQLS